jgi:hypothetical protein
MSEDTKLGLVIIVGFMFVIFLIMLTIKSERPNFICESGYKLTRSGHQIFDEKGNGIPCEVK